MLYINNLPKASRVMIQIPYNRARQKQVIEGWLSDSFSLNTSASWSDPTRNNSTMVNSTNEVMTDLFKANALFAGGNTQVQRQVVSLMETIASYQASGLIGFSLRLNFLAVRSTDNVLDDINALQSCTLPAKFENKPANTGDNKNTAIMGRIIAPMYYTMTNSTCIAVNIGRWFHTPQVLLIKSVNATFSKETVRGSGLPLYATADISFQAYRRLDADDVAEWFTLTGTAQNSEGDEQQTSPADQA